MTTATPNSATARADAVGNERPPTGIGVVTMLGVLVGNRQSILRAAEARGTILLGAVLVLAAGLARNYDGEDLRREPWWLAVPFAVSAGLGLLVYALARVNVSQPPKFWTGYRSFLGVMWLIAPTALPYGVPWERMLTPVDAVAANLWTLAIVSLWRVTLMARIVSVLAGLRFTAAFFRVMLVAGTVAFVGLLIVPKPLIHFMGGVRQTDAERLVAGVSNLATFASGLLMVVWIGGGTFALTVRGTWAVAANRRAPVSRGAFVLAALCLVPWLIALPRAQSEQRLRHDAESLLQAGRIDQALVVMSAHGPEAFPRHWDPPPKVGWDVRESPPVLDVLERVVALGITGWVRDAYVQKFERGYLTAWGAQDEDRSRVERLMTQMPEADALRIRQREWARRWRYEPAEPLATTTRSATAPTAGATTGATTRGITP
jgi:hypothetical protein